jgi:hypothetical protein
LGFISEYETQLKALWAKNQTKYSLITQYNPTEGQLYVTFIPSDHSLTKYSTPLQNTEIEYKNPEMVYHFLVICFLIADKKNTLLYGSFCKPSVLTYAEFAAYLDPKIPENLLFNERKKTLKIYTNFLVAFLLHHQLPVFLEQIWSSIIHQNDINDLSAILVALKNLLGSNELSAFDLNTNLPRNSRLYEIADIEADKQFEKWDEWKISSQKFYASRSDTLKFFELFSSMLKFQLYVGLSVPVQPTPSIVISMDTKSSLPKINFNFPKFWMVFYLPVGAFQKCLIDFKQLPISFVQNKTISVKFFHELIRFVFIFDKTVTKDVLSDSSATLININITQDDYKSLMLKPIQHFDKEDKPYPFEFVESLRYAFKANRADRDIVLKQHHHFTLEGKINHFDGIVNMYNFFNDKILSSGVFTHIVQSICPTLHNHQTKIFEKLEKFKASQKFNGEDVAFFQFYKSSNFGSYQPHQFFIYGIHNGEIWSTKIRFEITRDMKIQFSFMYPSKTFVKLNLDQLASALSKLNFSNSALLTFK